MTSTNTLVRGLKDVAKATGFSQLSFEHARDLLVQWVEKARDSGTPPTSTELEQIGFTFIDHGSFANTFITPCSRFVLKVNHTYDEAYRRFIDLALTRQDNPHYPQIYFAAQKPDFQVVLMEFLDPLDYENEPMAKQADYLQQQVCFGIMPRDPEGSEEFLRMLWDMWALIEQDAVTEDLSGRNIMIRRKNGHDELVITDPVSPLPEWATE